jgi:hypothetical protein
MAIRAGNSSPIGARPASGLLPFDDDDEPSAVAPSVAMGELCSGAPGAGDGLGTLGGTPDTSGRLVKAIDVPSPQTPAIEAGVSTGALIGLTIGASRAMTGATAGASDGASDPTIGATGGNASTGASDFVSGCTAVAKVETTGPATFVTGEGAAEGAGEATLRSPAERAASVGASVELTG